jgi:mono/diheme cytochrome c family protein
VLPAELSPEELIEAGRSAYNANCIACHSLDPTKDGALGPAVADSSLALLDARVLRAEYPEGYEPKRPTRVMIALPHLEPRLIELAAYLGSLE